MLSQLLDATEREVTFGDLEELGDSKTQAFTSVLGLVLRRQWQPWKEWRPWFVLVTMVVPIAALLASLCNDLEGKLFPALVLWSHHRMVYATGVRTSAEAVGLSLNILALVLWSWSSAFAAAAIARKAIYVPTIVFFLLSLAVQGSFVLREETAWSCLPVVLLCLLVLVPACYGLRRGAARSAAHGKRQIFLVLGITLASTLAMWTRGWDSVAMENWSHGGNPLTLGQLVLSGAAWQEVTTHLLAILALTFPTLVYWLKIHFPVRLRFRRKSSSNPERSADEPKTKTEICPG